MWVCFVWGLVGGVAAACMGCSLLFSGSCGEKNKRCMHSHPHPAAVNMEPRMACAEIRLCHTETGAENRCNRKKQPSPLAVLWHPKKRHARTKREKPKIDLFIRGGESWQSSKACFYVVLPFACDKLHNQKAIHLSTKKQKRLFCLGFWLLLL